MSPGMTRGLSGRSALVFSLAVLAVVVYAAYETNTGFSTRARLLANTIIVPAIVLAVIQVVREARRAVPLSVPPEAVVSRPALMWTVAFFASMWAAGLAVTIPLFAFVYLRFAAGETLPRAAIYALVASIVIQLLFDRLLHVPLPAGAIPLPAITP